MAIKMIDKKDCEYKGGYIVSDGKIVCVDNKIVELFNQLDTDVQRAQFEASKPVVIPFTGEFERKTERGAIYPVIVADTPELDKMTDRAIRIMDEFDSMESVDKVNEYFEGIMPLVEFVNDDFIVSCDQEHQARFDLPTIGSPLEIDKDTLAEWIVGLFE